MTIRPAGKALIFLVGVSAAVFGYRHAVYSGLVPRPNALKTVIPLKAELANEQVIAFKNVSAAPIPSISPARVDGPGMHGLVWAWNAQLALLYSIGGPCTTSGSFMAAHHVKVCVTRQDDTGQMQNELVKFASDLSKGNSNPENGAHFVVIMGDGAAQFLQAINPQLEKLGPDYIAEIIGSVGYSRGEDKLMGPPEWLQNPRAALGKTVAGVIRDGDWNIAMKWAKDNEIPNNPDDKLYDPKALNWINAPDYVDAAQKYVAGFCDAQRPVKGERGKTVAPCVDGVVTWTPGDVIIAEGKGGLVGVLSTKENAWQMPAVVIGIKKWFNQNRPTTEGFLAAAFDAADQVKTNPAAFQRAAEISAAVYKEKDAAYWAKYFCGSNSMGSIACQGKGAAAPDKQGIPVDLGGSAVSNLADNLQMVNRNILRASYTSFGEIAHQQYPNIIPTYPKFETVFDPSFIMDVSRAEPAQSNVANAERTTYKALPISQIRGKAKWSILFRTGSAEIDPRSEETLNELYNNLVIQKMSVEVDGHTDGTGSPALNRSLSEQRAESVKAWLQGRSAVDFPDSRVRVHGFGPDQPVASNATEAGRAQNRRVEIIVGTN
jgi:OOP family OmpA-OmpF porin